MSTSTSTIVGDTRRYLTRSERDLLTAISRYCRTAGWRMGGAHGGLGDFVAPDLSIDVDWWSYRRGDSTLLQISTLSQWGTHTRSICHVEIHSVREAVDIAVALGFLPQDFSSAYQAGRADVASGPRYSEPLDLVARQIHTGFQLCGTVMDDAGVEQPSVEVVTAVRDCTMTDCVNRLLWDCVVMDLDGDLRDDGLDVHFAADTALQARIPAAAL